MAPPAFSASYTAVVCRLVQEICDVAVAGVVDLSPQVKADIVAHHVSAVDARAVYSYLYEEDAQFNIRVAAVIRKYVADVWADGKVSLDDIPATIKMVADVGGEMVLLHKSEGVAGVSKATIAATIRAILHCCADMVFHSPVPKTEHAVLSQVLESCMNVLEVSLECAVEEGWLQRLLRSCMPAP